MAKKVRLCRAVESNVGERRAYKKQLVRLHKQFSDFILNQLFLEMQADSNLVFDASPLRPNQREKEILKAIKNKIPKGVKDFTTYLWGIISANINKWLRLLKTASMPVIEKFVKKAVTSTTRAQKQAFLSAGVKVSAIEQAWSVPIVGRQYIAPQMANAMPDLIEGNVSLITKIGQKDITRIADVLIKGVESGLDYDAIRDELKQTEGFDSARADRVALDQINKINAQTQELNAKALGCTKGRWKHVPGQYTSRKTHIKFDGMEYDLNKGLFDSDVQKFVKPAELPYCRCVMRLVLPQDILNE